VTDFTFLHAIEAALVMLATAWVALALVTWERVVRPSHRFKKTAERVESFASQVYMVVGALLAAPILYVLYAASVSALAVVRGPAECRSALEREEPEFYSAHVVRGGMWVRRYDGHLISAVRAVPRSLSGEGTVTVVCHFGADTFDFSHFEVLDGDRTGHLRTVSSWSWVQTTS
jgi:hypothetical protein